MASRFTVSTDFLQIREVVAKNPMNGDFIQPYQIPMIRENGRMKWHSTIELLSTIIVPSVSSSVLEILTCTQPAISTLSTVMGSTTTSFLTSTVAGLGSMSYVSTPEVILRLNLASHTHLYVSAPSMYNTINYLADMKYITRVGENFGAMTLVGSNMKNGYVSTVNPGEYKIYKSSIGLMGSNILNRQMTNNIEVPSMYIPMLSYKDHIVNCSKMAIDIYTNAKISFNTALTNNATIEFYFIEYGGYRQVGSSMLLTIPAGMSNIDISQMRIMLDANDLTPFPNALELKHKQSNSIGIDAYITTLIPDRFGVFVTLDNTD